MREERDDGEGQKNKEEKEGENENLPAIPVGKEKREYNRVR